MYSVDVHTFNWHHLYFSVMYSTLSLSACPLGTYSEGGDSSCQPCNSNAECPCVPGYYRAPGEGPSVACTRE